MQSQSLSLDAARAFADALPSVPSSLTDTRGLVALPDLPAVTAYGFDLAAELLAAQKDFALTLASTFIPAKTAESHSAVNAMRRDDGKTMMSEESAQGRNLLGSFIRAQRQMANLSLRELSAMTEVSNPYPSQIERGLSEPSARVLKSIAQALNLSAEALFAQAGLIPEWTRRDDDATETALRTDPRLTEPQKRALLAVYRSYIGANGQGTADDAADN